MLLPNRLGAAQAAAVAGVLAAARDGDAAAAVGRAGRLWPGFDWDGLVDVWTESEEAGSSEGQALTGTMMHVRRDLYGDDEYAAWDDIPIRPADSDEPDDVAAVGDVAHRHDLTDVKMSRRWDLDGTHWTMWVTTADGRRLSVSTASTLGGLGIAERVGDDPTADTPLMGGESGIDPIWEAADSWRSPAEALDIGLTVAQHLQRTNRR